MKIGLAVTCRNAWEWTEACLASVRSEHEIFVVVVDDGSTDGTKAGLKKWQSEDKKNRWVFSDPPFDSLAGKWNIAVAKCWEEGCDYVCVSNNDVLYHPETLDRLAGYLDTIPDPPAARQMWQSFAPSDDSESGSPSDGHPLIDVMVTAHNIEGIFTEKGIPPEFIMSEECKVEEHPVSENPDFSCFMISKTCWEQVGQFDERYVPAYFEDNDYHERILRGGYRAVSLPTAPYYHYGSVTRNEDHETPNDKKHERFRSTRHEFYRKWGFIPHGDAVLPARPKLLIVGDGHRPSGFARVVHAIAGRLVEDFEIHHLAINYWGDPHGMPWQMYPAGLSHPPDTFGRRRIAEIYELIKPDAVLMVQDPWHIAEYIRAKHGMRGLVCYYPIDSPNIDPSWISFLARCPEVCTYTDFGAEQSALAAEFAFDESMRNVGMVQGPGEYILSDINFPPTSDYHDPDFTLPLKRLHDLRNVENYNVIPHGVDLDKFFKVDKADARKRLGVKGDFVVGYVHRNQPRKRQDAMIRAFAKFVTGYRGGGRIKGDEVTEIRNMPSKYPDATLVIHTALDAMEGWNIEALIAAYGLEGQVFLTPPSVQASSYNESDLNLLLNTFDVNANLGGGEGWGLSAMESAAVGVAQIVPDWSATKEIWDGKAALVPIAEIVHAGSGLNTAQAQVDTDAAAEYLKEFYEDREWLAEMGELASDYVHDPKFSWDTIAGQFKEVIMRSMLKKGVPQEKFKVNIGSGSEG